MLVIESTNARNDSFKSSFLSQTKKKKWVMRVFFRKQSMLSLLRNFDV